MWEKNNISKNFLDNYEHIRHNKLLPSGVYLCQLTKWTTGANRNDNPYVRFHYNVVQGQYQDTTLSDDKFFTEKAAPYSKDFCDGLGIDPRREVGEYPPIFVNVETSIVDSANGRKYVRVESVRPAQPPAQPMAQPMAQNGAYQPLASQYQQPTGSGYARNGLSGSDEWRNSDSVGY